MLNLRILRGPLQPHENDAILSEYNRLTNSRIPLAEFLHWVQQGPAGPACHAILETDDGKIVAHTSLIPFRSVWNGRPMVPAKSEYSFILEEIRSMKIRGMEEATRLKNLTLIEGLFRFCFGLGWGPLFISTNAAVHRLFRSVGCYPVTFPVWECLLVLRPWKAARETPNLSRLQRASLFVAGVFQRLAWIPAGIFIRSSNVRQVDVEGHGTHPDRKGLAFFQDVDSLKWRYLSGQYERLEGDGGEEHAIYKNGEVDRYLRVCQWQVGGGGPSAALIAKLVQLAHQQEALGVRWAIYGGGPDVQKFTRRMRWLAFLCAERMRTVLVSSPQKEFLAGENWSLNDAMFSFDP